MENQLYTVTLRAKQTPHKVEAATVKTEGERLIFTNSEGQETGNFRALDVMGYSIEPEMPTIDIG